MLTGAQSAAEDLVAGFALSDVVSQEAVREFDGGVVLAIDGTAFSKVH